MLYQTVFDGANLEGADLRGAGCNLNTFRNAILIGANLSGLNLNAARFINANLRNADLRGTALSGDVLGADFTNADLRGTNFGNVDLSQSRLAGVRFDRANMYGIQNIDNWQTIKSIKDANVHRIREPWRQNLFTTWVCPKSVEEFYLWALEQGAVDLEWEAWVEYRKAWKG